MKLVEIPEMTEDGKQVYQDFDVDKPDSVVIIQLSEYLDMIEMLSQCCEKKGTTRLN